MTISFDGPDKAMYEIMRKGAKYEVTLENVRQFLSLVKEYRENGRPTPYTVMQVILPYDATQKGPNLRNICGTSSLTFRSTNGIRSGPMAGLV